MFTGFHQLIRRLCKFSGKRDDWFWLRQKSRAAGSRHAGGSDSVFLFTKLCTVGLFDRILSENRGRFGACYIAGIPLFWNTLQATRSTPRDSLAAWLGRAQILGSANRSPRRNKLVGSGIPAGQFAFRRCTKDRRALRVTVPDGIILSFMARLTQMDDIRPKFLAVRAVIGLEVHVQLKTATKLLRVLERFGDRRTRIRPSARPAGALPC